MGLKKKLSQRTDLSSPYKKIHISGGDPGFNIRGHFLARGWGRLGPHRAQGYARWGTGGEVPLKLLGIRKYRTSFLNRNWLKLYHVRHDASHRRCVQWSMMFYSWRKALLRLQYEEQQSKAFACSRKICVISFNTHYPILAAKRFFGPQSKKKLGPLLQFSK